MKYILAKILLFFSQFCYDEIVDVNSQQLKKTIDNFDPEIKPDLEHLVSLEQDFEFLRELNPALYIIFGTDDDGEQFVNINWKDEHPEVVKFLVGSLISLGSGSPAALIVDILIQAKEQETDTKKHEIITATLDSFESITPQNSINVKDNPVMSPLQVFQNLEGPQ